ncbi:hypothetical protein SAMD00079811_39940 [Scytonema sp. HK-05]|nr:hypothetical protein SAMD00079811_39940 [Scytonema sp. HK-05]
MRGISILNRSRNLVKDKHRLGSSRRAANTFKTTVVSAVMSQRRLVVLDKYLKIC